jgi:hypothetical protein
MSHNIRESDPTRLTEDGVVLNAPTTYLGAIEHTIVAYHLELERCAAIFAKCDFQSVEPVEMTLERKRQLFNWAPPDFYPPHLHVLDEHVQPFDPESLLETQQMLAPEVPSHIKELAPDPKVHTTIAHLEARNKELREIHGGQTRNMFLNANIGDRSDWYTDKVFGQQQLTGVNPTTITIASESWIAIFTEAAATESSHVQELLSTRAATGSLFVQDYSDFRSAAGVAEDTEMKSGDGLKYLCASVALFNLEDGGLLHPLAIIIDWKGSLAKSVAIFNRRVNSRDKQDEKNNWPWRFAKTCITAADWTRHEIGVHLVNTHLVEEAIIVAAHRTLPPTHPVFKLLEPHWSVTLSVNFAARQTLVPGVIAQLAGCAPPQLFAVLNHAYQTFDFTGQYVPNDLKKRGFPTDKRLSEPKYHNYGYARNIVKTWETLRKFVGSVLTKKYPGGDKDVAKDTFIADFSREMRSRDGAQLNTFPIVNKLEELIDMVTMCIHIASFQHSAVNYLQEYYQVFIPNKPSAIYAPLPASAEILAAYTERSLIDALPVDHYRDWLISAQLPYLLSFQVAADQNILQYADLESKNPDPAFRDAAITFRTHLDKLDKLFEKISLELDDHTRPYNVLDPKLTASSIVI